MIILKRRCHQILAYNHHAAQDLKNAMFSLCSICPTTSSVVDEYLALSLFWTFSVITRAVLLNIVFGSVRFPSFLKEIPSWNVKNRNSYCSPVSIPRNSFHIPAAFWICIGENIVSKYTPKKVKLWITYSEHLSIMNAIQNAEPTCCSTSLHRFSPSTSGPSSVVPGIATYNKSSTWK